MNATHCFLKSSIAGFLSTCLLAAAQARDENETPLPPADLPDIGGARVTIPYSELKALLQAAEGAKGKGEAEMKAPPPVTGIIRSANYTLAAGARSCRLEAVYEIDSLADSWQAIPLLAGDARLESATTDGASVIWHDNGYCLLVNSKGAHTARLTLAAPGSEQWNNDPGMRFVPGEATLSRLEITGLGEQQDVEIGALPSTRSAEGAVVFHLPGSGGENFLHLTRAILETAPESKTPAEIVPSTWNLHSEILAEYTDGRLSYRCNLYCQTGEGSGVSIDLALPPKAGGLLIDGDDLHRWQIIKNDEGRRLARVFWKTRDILDRKLTITYDIPQSPLAGEWEFQAPSVAEEGSTQTLFAIAAIDGLELTAADLKAAVQSRRLPSWMNERLGQRDFLTAEVGSHNITARANWLPRLKTAQAVIKNASYQMRLVTNGAMLTQAECTIEHRASLNWVLDVPQGSDFIKCEIDGRVMKPIKRGDTQIEFPLPAPADDDTVTTKVTFMYSNGSAPLDPVSGKIELALPRTDLFIHRLDWELSIPGQYATTGIQGNLDIANEAESQGSDAIHLRKELCRGEQPATEIYYEKRGLPGN